MSLPRKKSVGPSGAALIRFVLNGETVEAAFSPHKTLLEVLREDLRLTGTKHGCELGGGGAGAARGRARPPRGGAGTHPFSPPACTWESNARDGTSRPSRAWRERRGS